MLSLCSTFLNIRNGVIPTSPGLWPGNFICHGLSGFSAPSPGLCPIFLSLYCVAWKLSRQQAGSEPRAHRVCVLSFRYSTLFCPAWCLMTDNSFVFSFSCSSRMVYMFHLSWQWESKMYLESTYIFSCLWPSPSSSFSWPERSFLAYLVSFLRLLVHFLTNGPNSLFRA